MAQWINVLRNNSFVNPTRLPFLCRIFRAVALAEPGLTAGWLAGWLAGWPADEMRVNFEFLKSIIDQIFKLFCCFYQSYSIIRAIGMHLSWYFEQKSVLRRLLEV